MNKQEIENHRRLLIELNKEQLITIKKQKEKIDKAIDYIKRNSYGWETKYFQDDALASELLEILGDKE